jgi:hypothetical protein
MKKALLLLGILMSFALVSCADDPYTANGKISNGGITITLDDNGTPLKGFTIGTSQVTNAVIKLTSPSGLVQTGTWNVGNSKVFTFNADVTGNYTISLKQVDTSNTIQNDSTNFNLVAGVNYYIGITLGGNVVVNLGGTNGTTSSASSVSSTVSSVSSSVSSVSSSSSSVVSGNVYGIYNNAVQSVVWDTTVGMGLWNDSYNSGGATLASDITTYSTGTTNSLKIGAITGKGWFGLSFGTLPTGTLINMSAYSGGHLYFWFKSAYGIKEIGLQSGAANNQVFVLAAALTGYGLVADNAWHQVSIPMSAFAGIDFTQINSYFIMVADGANYTSASAWNIDNVYWTKN